MPRDYRGNSEHERLLREKYNDVYREVYRRMKKLGEEEEVDFNYPDYFDATKLSGKEKDDFNDALSEFLTSYKDGGATREALPSSVKIALSDITNSTLLEDEDKILDVTHFMSLGEKLGTVEMYREMIASLPPTRRPLPSGAAAPTPDASSGSSAASEGGDSPAGDEPATEHEGDTPEVEPSAATPIPTGSEGVAAHDGDEPVTSSEIDFAGYNKKLSFFKAIKEAYRNRKEKTDSRFLGVVSATRAALCKLKVPLTFIGLLSIGIPAGAILAAGSTLPLGVTLVHLPSVLATTTSIVVGANLAGLAMQKWEDGKVHHGLIGGFLNLNRESSTLEMPTPSLTPTPTPTPVSGLEGESPTVADEADREADLGSAASEREGEREAAPLPHTTTEQIRFFAPRNDIMTEEELKSLRNDLTEKTTFLMNPRVEYKEKRKAKTVEELDLIKNEYESLRDRLRRSKSLTGLSMEGLKEELEREKKRLSFWQKNANNDEIAETETRIAYLRQCILSAENTRSIEELNKSFAEEPLEGLEGKDLKTRKKMLKRTQEELLYEANTRRLTEQRQQLLNKMQQELASSLTEEGKKHYREKVETLKRQLEDGSYMSPTRRLQELRRAKEIAVHQGRFDIVNSLDKEINVIITGYGTDKEAEEAEMHDWAVARIAELQSIQDEVGEIPEFAREIYNLQTKYKIETYSIEDTPVVEALPTEDYARRRAAALEYYKTMGLFGGKAESKEPTEKGSGAKK